MGSYSGVPELMHLLLTSWFTAGRTFFVRLLNGLGSFRRVRIDNDRRSRHGFSLIHLLFCPVRLDSLRINWRVRIFGFRHSMLRGIVLRLRAAYRYDRP
jgi:hypothetical protein